MRFVFKTSYDQDIQLFRHGGQTFWYGLLALGLLAAPSLVPEYYLSQLTFICIYAIVGVGLMLLTGYTGQVSLGHAAFLAVGAYAEAVLQVHGVPFAVSLVAAAVLAGLAGIIIGLPALRLTGIYLVIATMAFGFIVQEGLTRWESVTRGSLGMTLRSIDLFGVRVDEEWELYYLALAVLTLVVLGVLNLLRAPTGRAFVAIRDSEISAQSMGIHLARYKTASFALSAAITGLAGALYAHKLQFISPEQFGIILSIELAMMIFIGGIGSLHGAIYGAIFLIALPQADRSRQGLPAGRHRPSNRARADGLRPDPRAGDRVRAARHLRSLAQGAPLPAELPALQAGHVPAPEDVHEIGASQMSLLRVENLSIHFGGIKAVNDVGFEVIEGEVFTIIGPNGAGKTTIFNLISRLYAPTTGRILFGDVDVTQRAPHEIAGLGIARTFQNIELFEHATVLDNLLIGRHCHRRTGLWANALFLPRVHRAERAQREAVERVIDLLDLAHYRDSRVEGLPYGVRKVVELGRALAMQPRLLLLDEPSSGLNVEETDDMAWWIRDIKQDLGVTVLMVEHDMNLVARVSDRVLALNYGQVLTSGTPAEVQRHPDVIEAYLGG